jgi:hypothetical protein
MAELIDQLPGRDSPVAVTGRDLERESVSEQEIRGQVSVLLPH